MAHSMGKAGGIGDRTRFAPTNDVGPTPRARPSMPPPEAAVPRRPPPEAVHVSPTSDPRDRDHLRKLHR